MTVNIEFTELRVPKGFRGQVIFTRVLEEVVIRSLGAIAPGMLQQLKNKTIAFSGTTRNAWEQVGPRLAAGRRQIELIFRNDGPPKQQTGGILAAIQEDGPGSATFGRQPPIRARGDGRDLTDWVERNLAPAFDGNLTDRGRRRQVDRTAFRIARAIKRRGLSSSSNAGAKGDFRQVFISYVPRLQEAVGDSVEVAIEEWAES